MGKFGIKSGGKSDGKSRGKSGSKSGGRFGGRSGSKSTGKSKGKSTGKSVGKFAGKSKMKFTQLDTKMRVYETAHDYCVPPGIWMVARLDGRSFTRLTKDLMECERPFDLRFRDVMTETTKYLMSEVGFQMLYGYTESDEISILISPTDQTFGRKLRKLNSILAGEASAQFSRRIDHPAVFDCRVSCLPNRQLVVDYFRWRQADAERNSLNSWCYWKLRGQDHSAQAATNRLSGMSVAEKNELLHRRGINYNDLPCWQRRGCGVVWQPVIKKTINQHTKEEVHVVRRRLAVDSSLPRGDEYQQYLEKMLKADE